MTIYNPSFPAVPELAERGVIKSLLLENPRIELSSLALVDSVGGASLTYQELIDETLRFGEGFSRTFQRGQIILIFSLNSIQYPVIALAALSAGLVTTTANPAYRPLELVHQIKDSQTSVVFASSDFVDIAKEAMKLAGLPDEAIYLLPGGDGKVATGEKSYLDLRGKEGFQPVEIVDKKGTPAYLPYSSGTTGQPKGVQLSHYNLESITQQVAMVPLTGQKTVQMGIVPFFHCYGLVCFTHQVLFNGGTVVFVPKYELLSFCEAVQRYKPKILMTVPPAALQLAKDPRVSSYDLSSIQYVVCGAAPLSADLQQKVAQRIGPNTQMHQGYGMTETTGIATVSDLGAPVAGSCGRLISNMEARLVDDDGVDVPFGEAGELWLRGPNILMGYHNNVTSTQNTVTSDGWLKTGDVCMRSEAGDFFVTDRKKELIKVNGMQVAPAELEALLVSCPWVNDAAVIGVWNDEKYTEFPMAYVVVTPGKERTEKTRKEIGEFVASRVVSYKRLGGGIVFLDEIPKSPSGKILRKDLRVMQAKGSVVSANL